MNGKVLDIEGASSQSGAKVLMYDQKDPSGADNQLWFEDRYGNIRSKLNPRLVLDASGKITYLFVLILPSRRIVIVDLCYSRILKQIYCIQTPGSSVNPLTVGL